jgi:hypothetical protein
LRLARLSRLPKNSSISPTTAQRDHLWWMGLNYDNRKLRLNSPDPPRS